LPPCPRPSGEAVSVEILMGMGAAKMRVGTSSRRNMERERGDFILVTKLFYGLKECGWLKGDAEAEASTGEIKLNMSERMVLGFSYIIEETSDDSY
jgi:hypothetical protein